MSRKYFLAAACGVVFSLSSPCAADDDDEKQQAAAEQLEFMLSSVRDLRVAPTGNEPPAWKFHPKPLLRWTNPVGGASDGIVAMWHDGIRPTLVATVFQSKRGDWVQEYSSLASCSFSVRDGNEVFWERESEADEFRPLDDAPTPADSSGKRLAQMRAIGRQFSAYDDFASTNQTVRHELRLLTNPLYRYEAAEKGVIDGALFAFVLGTDPELLLMLEARTNGDGARSWVYRFEAMTVWAVEVKRQDRSIWNVGKGPRDDLRQRLIQRE